MKMRIEVDEKVFEVDYDADIEKEVELAFKSLHEFLEKFDLETDVSADEPDEPEA